MEKTFTFPPSLKFLIITLNFIIVIGVLYYLQDIFMPIVFAILISVLLYPICKRLENYKISRAFAIIITIIAIFSVASSILIILTSQILELSKDFPSLSDKIMNLSNQFLPFFQEYLHISPTTQVDILKKGLSTGLEAGGSMIGGILNTATSFFSSVSIITIYVFLILYYRDLFSNFLVKIVAKENQPEVTDVIDKIDHVIYNYISGLMIVIIIVAILNIIGLKLIGVEYAFFFGVFAALLTIIPYFGIFIGAILPTIVAFIMHDSMFYPLGVILVFSFVQFLEGNIITPKIIGSKVEVNAMAAIIALIIGGKLWGASGMILAIPIIAILKVIFDRIPRLHPIGYLLGGEIHLKENKDSLFYKIKLLLQKLLYKVIKKSE